MYSTMTDSNVPSFIELVANPYVFSIVTAPKLIHTSSNDTLNCLLRSRVLSLAMTSIFGQGEERRNGALRSIVDVIGAIHSTMSDSTTTSFIELMNTPKTFLRSVSNMLQEEDKHINTLKDLMRSNALAVSMPRVFSRKEVNRDEALWTIANLIVADDTELRTYSIQHVREKKIVDAAIKSYLNDSNTTAKSAAYFLCNWAGYIDNAADAKRHIMDLLPIALARKSGSRDILWAAIHVGDRFPETIPVYLLTTALRNSETMLPNRCELIWRLISRVAEVKGLADGCIDTLMLRLDTVLSKDKRDNQYLEALWILSNLLCESNSVEMFHHKYYSLRRKVENIVQNETDNLLYDNFLHEAMFVLGNYVFHAEAKEIQRYLAADKILPSLFRKHLHHYNPSIVTIAEKSLEKLEQYAAENQVDADTDTDSEIIILDDDNTTVSAPNDADDISNVPIKVENNCYCPTAYDLFAGTSRGQESTAVRGLVSLVSDKPAGTWEQISLDYTLTMRDLVNIHNMGYIIKDGFISVNLEIFTSTE